MMNKNKPKGSVLGLVLMFVALAAYLFYGKPLVKAHDILLKNLDDQSVVLQKFKDEEAEIESIKEEYGLTDSLEQLEVLAAIPIGLGQDEVLRTLISIAEENDIDLSSISFSLSGSDVENVNVLSISSSFQGSYYDLISFLEGLETDSRLFKVNNISVQVNKTGISGLDRVHFSLSIDTFYQE